MSRQHTEELTRRIEALLSSTPTRLSGIELVAVELAREGRRAVIRVFIDREGSAPARPGVPRELVAADAAAAGDASSEEGVPTPAVTGVSHEDCARVTRLLGDHLDSDPDLVPLLDAVGPYVLEVSSPGIERPLRTPAHFDRFRGEEAAVVTNQKILGRLNHSGIIAEVSPEAVILDQPDLGRTEIRYTEIKKAHLKCDPWQMVRAAARQKQS